MKNFDVIVGFLYVLGIDDLKGFAWPSGSICVFDATHITLRGMGNAMARIAKDAFSDALLVNFGFGGCAKYSFDREAVIRRAKGAEHRKSDAAGKKREQEMADKYTGAKIALDLIGFDPAGEKKQNFTIIVEDGFSPACHYYFNDNQKNVIEYAAKTYAIDGNEVTVIREEDNKEVAYWELKL